MKVKMEVTADNGKEELIMQEVKKMVRKVHTIPGIRNFQITVGTVEKEEEERHG